jgi:hypothetical protein
MSSRRPVALTPPDRIYADIGRTTTITMFLTELAGVSRDVIVRALGNLSGPLPARQVRLEAGATVKVDIDVAIPHGMPPGQHNFLFEVVDRDTGSVIDSLETSVDVQHTKAVRMHVSPASIRRRRRGRIRIIVRNHDEETQHIRLRAETDDHETQVTLESPDVSVRPGELVRVSGRVKAKAFYIGKQKERWYSIIGDGAGTPIYTRGNVRQMPVIGKNIKGVMVLLTILMVWAGSTLAIIRAISPATSEVTAGASAGPADPGAGGDQDGAGAAGAEPILVDVSGTVTAVPDGSGVVVTWRSVSLGDAATEGKVAAGTSTDSPDIALQQTETDEAGAFVVPGIDALGLYEFSFFKAGHQTTTLIVQPNGEPVTLEVALEAGSGFIGGSTVDAAGNPLGGVDVTLTDGAITYSLSTPTSGDSAGRFSFANLSSPATYVLDARVAGRGLASTTIELATGQSIGDVRLVLSPDVATLAGKITAAAFESGSTAAADFRVGQDVASDFGPTFTVTATDGSLTRSTTTLTEGLLAGTFRLEQLPVGRTYTITYEAPGFQTLTEQIELTLSTSEREISMVRSTGRLRGKVTITGSTLSPTSVAVTVTNPDNTYKTTDAISSDGSLLVDGIVPGAYVVVFEALGLEKQVREVDIGAGTSTELNVSLAATQASPIKSSLSFKVVKGGNDTTTQVTASLKFRAAGDCGAVGTDTDCTYSVNLSDGNVVITGLEAGGYVIDFTAVGFAPRRISAQVAASTAAPQQEVVMVPLGSLQGLVADETSAPIQGLQLGLYLGTALIASTTTSASGEYLFSRKLLPDTYSVRVTGSGFLPVERSVVGALSATLNLDITVRGKSLITGEIRSLDLLTGNYVAVEPRDYAVFIRQNKAPSNNQWVDAATLGVAETLGAYRMALEPTLDPNAQPVLNDPPYDICVVIITQPDTAISSSACSQTVVGLTSRTSQALDIELGETLTRSFYFSPDPGSVSGSVTVGGVARGGVKVEARRIDETGRVLESSSLISEDGLVNGQQSNTEVVGRFVFSSLTPVKALPTPPPNPGAPIADEQACTFSGGGSCWVIRASEEGTGFSDSPQLTIYPARSLTLTQPINIVKAGGTYNVTFTDDRGETLVGVSAIVYRKSSPPNGYDKNSWDGTCGALPNCAVSSQATPILSFPGLDPAEYVLDTKYADYRDLSVTFNVTQGAVVDQVQKLVATKGNLLIDVRNASGSPIGGAQVWIGTSFAASAYSCETNIGDDDPVVGAAEGTCLISGIPEGVKTLSIDAAGSPRGTIVATVIGGQTIGAAAVLGSTQAVLRVATFTNSGTVLDGVTVAVEGQPAATCLTDQTGQCEIPGLAVGSFVRVIGSKANYRSAAASLAVGSGTTGVSLALVPSRTLTVTITGNGNALSGVAVTAVDGAGDEYSCANPGTDNAGTCSIDNLPLGNVVVTATIAGWVTESRTVSITSAPSASVTFPLTPAVATLSGKVTASGSDVSGAVVAATNGFGTSISTVSDSSGNYVFANLAAGNWNLTVSAVGFETLTLANVSVTAGQTTTQNLALTALGGSLTLTARTSSGTAIEGLTITLSRDNNSIPLPATADPHVYAATSISPGQYVVSITDPNSRYASQSFVVNIERGYATSLPVYLGTTRSVLVVAVAGIPADGFGPQSPLDVKIRATGPDNAATVVRTVARLDRSVATFTDLLPGTYTIEIDDQDVSDLTQFTARTEIAIGSPPANTYTVAAARTIEVLAASTNDAGLWLLPKAVVDVNVPVSVDGATVQLSNGYLLSPASALSANGSATISGVPPGTYTLDVSRSGYVTSTSTVTIGDKSQATAGTITLSAVTLSGSTEPGTLTATVTDNASPAANLAGATVLLVETGQSCSTSAAGTCTIVAPPGSYTLRASHSGHSSASTASGAITVSPGLPSTTSISLAPSTATVDFTVTDGTNPLASAQIRDVLAGTTHITDANGTYSWSNLSATDTFFEISRAGHATVHLAIRPVAGETRALTIRLTPVPTPTNTLSVLVVDARTGTPLEGVAVTTSDDSTLCSTTTTAQGTCAPAAALSTGSLTLKAVKSGYVTTRTTVAITSEASTHVVIAMHPSTAILDVRVRDAQTGETLSGVTVSYTGSSGTHCNGTHPDTNASGLCEITGLSSGVLSLTLSKTHYASMTAVVTMEPGQRHSVDIHLHPRGSLAITVSPAATADTTFTIVGTGLNCVIVNGGTSCTIEHIPTGTWILRASATHTDRTVGIAKGSNSVSIS